jgi:hypothetical protein
VANKKLPDMQIIEADDRGLQIDFQRILAMIERIPDVGSIEELVARSPELVHAAVERIQDAVAPYDAFDVVESMKMRELSLGLVGFSEREHDGIAAAVEIASLVLLARGSRSGNASMGENPGLAVPVIHDEVQNLLLLAQLATFAQPASATAEGAAKSELAGLLKMYEISVRNRQFESIRAAHDSRLFGDVHVVADMKGALDFNYDEYLLVRQAVQELGGERLSAAANQFADAFQSNETSSGACALTAEAREAARTALNDLFLRPGDRAAFKAADIASRTTLDEAVVRAVLGPFSLTFVKDDGVAIVSKFLDGDNPFATCSLLNDSKDSYLSTGAQLGDDALRSIVEKALSGKAAERYNRARARLTEELAIGYFANVVRPDQQYLNLKYWMPAEGQAADVVASTGTNLRSIAQLTEMDALLVAEDVAICIEVKGKSLRRESRTGHGVKLADDLAKTVGEAAEQADRARRLIEENHGLQTESGWLDLSSVREVHSVVVTLDDLGPAGIALDLMVRAGIVTTGRVPWVVSLHDLAVIARVVDLPAELLLYIRRRTEPDFAKVYMAVDELDLFMLFLAGHLYLEPDPDKVAAANPAAPAPTSAERKRHLRSLLPTTVATHTDALDQWIYATERPDEPGADPDTYPKPVCNLKGPVREIVLDLFRERRPGWFRASADLLSFNGGTLSRIAGAIARTAASTRRDGQWHNAFISSMSEWGHFGLFIGSVPADRTIEGAVENLERYARAKSYQMHVDRSLGLLVTAGGQVVGGGYGNHDWQDNPELDALAAEMGLTAADRMPHSMPPPSSRRSTHRLHGNSRGKKKRK